MPESIQNVVGDLNQTMVLLPQEETIESIRRLYAAQEIVDNTAQQSEWATSARETLGIATDKLSCALGSIITARDLVMAYITAIGGASIVRPSRYDYVGPNTRLPGVAEGADNYLGSAESPFPENELKDHGLYPELQAIQDCAVALGGRLGVDLSDRMRPLDYFHVYTREGYQELRDRNGLPSGSRAVHATSGHIALSEGDNPTETLGNANHELIHVLSRKSIKIRIEQHPNGRYLSTDYAHSGLVNERNGRLQVVSEIVTEITNIDLIRNYWQKDPRLANATNIDQYEDIGYLPHLILFDGIMRKYFPDPKAVMAELQRGILLGKMGALKRLHAHLGTPMMDRLSRMDQDDTEGAAIIAEDLGMPEVATKIRNNDHTGLLSWL